MQKGQEDFACYTHDSSIEDGGLYLRIGCGCKFLSEEEI